MINADLAAFSKKWNSTIEAKQGRALTDRAMILIFENMCVYSFDDVCMALDKFIMNPDEGVYNLQPASIVKIIEGNSESAAMIAWALVDRIIRQCGAGDDIIMADKISMKVIQDLGGLIRTQEITDNGMPFFGREFRTLYQRYRISGCSSYPEKLVGKDNIQREAHGLPLLKPRMIGFESDNKIKLPDMSKSRYEQIENSAPVSAEQARENLKQLMSFVGGGE